MQTVEKFGNVRDVTAETRSNKMRSRIAACLYDVCTRSGLTRKKSERKIFCGINKHLTTAIDLLQVKENQGLYKRCAKGTDTRFSYANNICIKLGITSISLRSSIAKTVCEIVDKAQSNLISVSTMYDSKITGATYISLRLHGYDITVKKIGELCKIHHETLQRYIEALREYHNIIGFKEMKEKIDEDIKSGKIDKF